LGAILDENVAGSSPAPGHSRLRRLNINLLYALDALLHSPSLTAAARSIALSQPALSAKLRQLREHFGDELVVYGDKRRLTALGEALLHRVGPVLREVDDTFNLTLDFDPATAEREITITAPEAIELMFVSRIIPDIRAAAPGVQIRMVPFVHGAVQKLFDAGVDVAIVPHAMADPNLGRQPLFRHSLAGLVSRNHPFAERQVGEAEYLGARHAALLDEMEQALFGPYGPNDPRARRHIVARTSLNSMLPLLALGSDLVVTTSNWFAQYNAAILPLKLVDLDFEKPSSELVVQWQLYRSREPVIRWLVDQMARGVDKSTYRHPEFR
jgi:LysR family transcriptional regulator, nod-box dependent transcriptional activator